VQLHFGEEPTHVASGMSNPPPQSMVQTVAIPRHTDDWPGVTGFPDPDSSHGGGWVTNQYDESNMGQTEPVAGMATRCSQGVARANPIAQTSGGAHRYAMRDPEGTELPNPDFPHGGGGVNSRDE
jgi:hypothetical protein